MSSYHTASVLFRPDYQENDLFVAVGHMFTRAPTGDWMIRIDGMGGMTLYTSSPRIFGWLLGSQVGLARVWTGDYLQIGAFPVELFAIVGGGAYYGWRLEETPTEKGLVPVVTAGGGLRFHGDTPGTELVMLEVLREERIGVWAPRVFIRFGVGLPGRSAR